MASQNPSLTLLLSLCLVASVTSVRSRLSPDGSPSPSPSMQDLLSPSESPDGSPSPSPSMQDLLSPSEAAVGFSFNDAPARFEELPVTRIDIDLSSSLNAVQVSADPFVSRVCDNTDHPTLCLNTIVPFLKDDQADLESVLKASVEAGSEYAKEALSVVKDLAKRSDTSPAIKSTLKDCKNSYSTAVENFAKTTDAFATSDVGTMRSVLSATITFVGDCEDGFTAMRTPSPVKEYAVKLTGMTSNCLAIVAQMMN